MVATYIIVAVMDGSNGWKRADVEETLALRSLLINTKRETLGVVVLRVQYSTENVQ